MFIILVFGYRDMAHHEDDGISRKEGLTNKGVERSESVGVIRSGGGSTHE